MYSNRLANNTVEVLKELSYEALLEQGDMMVEAMKQHITNTQGLDGDGRHTGELLGIVLGVVKGVF